MDNIDDLISEDKNKITNSKSKAGRPQMSPAEKRTQKVMVYFNKKEYELLTQKAQEMDLRVADLARKAVIAYCKETK